MTDEKIPGNFKIYFGFLSPNYATFTAKTAEAFILYAVGSFIKSTILGYALFLYFRLMIVWHYKLVLRLVYLEHLFLGTMAIKYNPLFQKAE